MKETLLRTPVTFKNASKEKNLKAIFEMGGWQKTAFAEDKSILSLS